MKKFLLFIYYKFLGFSKWCNKVHNFLVVPFHKKPNIKNTDDSLQYIIDNKCSVSRFGDGEFELLFNGKIAFQKSNKRLVKIFKEIIFTEQENHITCLPFAIETTDIYTEKAQKYWDTYLSYHRLKLYKYLNFNKVYYDTQLSRLYMDTLHKKDVATRYAKIRQIWNNQDVVFVEGEKSKLGIGNDLFDNCNSIKRIICPATNAFDVYDLLLNYIEDNLKKDKLFLIALGPTATALAWDLHKRGYWAIDIGHIDIEYEWMKMGAIEKVPVENKFVGDTYTFQESNNNELLEMYKQEILTSFN